MVSPSALRGYVLEELLAALIKASGYDLLVHASQDPAALCSGSNGLRIRGRGADHQADVLGQLRLPVRFMLPLRLFVEAKCRKSPTGLADVRNALGVLNDVNEHYSTATAALSPDPYRRYDYRYALFSASGFTRDAELFAAAQRISLVDLRGPAFEWLLTAASRTADALLALADAEGVESFPVNQMREALRRALGTWPLSTPPSNFAEAESRARLADGAAPGTDRLPPDALAEVTAQAADLEGRLYLGFTASPFLLVLQPDDPDEAEAFLEQAPDGVFAELAFAGPDVLMGEWALTTGGSGRAPLTFRFGLPPFLEEWVLGTGADQQASSPRELSRVVTVALGQRNATLVFDPLPRPPRADASEGVAEPARSLRAMRLNRDLAFAGERPNDAASPDAAWTAEAIYELLQRLRDEGWPHADIIEHAAAQGGAVTRDEVYEIAGYADTRMLRGFTRPTRRITRDLIREGLVPAGAELPLQTRYAGGVLATHFVVPAEFAWLLG